ncbi:hypothetical protein BDK51DRAFT_34389 [Blyttiomyces helicus]|uniref:SF3 helicase domain-containing protein n=1 Tax=Blyttiomyces helicus TaxID=388810 RepID=A0A4P9WN34_9FUNG|nr:hypothetical protein BDK51DRAFT_34389 [Blyttiomyces helicus]|eukprot:RKO93912.1 hypothetical protein BDK51DRAFT_34389 [Blyttiomyces helicus]
MRTILAVFPPGGWDPKAVDDLVEAIHGIYKAERHHISNAVYEVDGKPDWRIVVFPYMDARLDSIVKSLVDKPDAKCTFSVYKGEPNATFRHVMSTRHRDDHATYFYMKNMEELTTLQEMKAYAEEHRMIFQLNPAMKLLGDWSHGEIGQHFLLYEHIVRHMVRNVGIDDLRGKFGCRLAHLMRHWSITPDCLQDLASNKVGVLLSLKKVDFVEGNAVELECEYNKILSRASSYLADPLSMITFKLRCMAPLIRVNGELSVANIATATHGWTKKEGSTFTSLIRVNFINILSHIRRKLQATDRLSDSIHFIVSSFSDGGKAIPLLVDTLRDYFLDITFHKKLDISPIIRFTDGVYDLTIGATDPDCAFRDGQPEDYCSKTSEVSYLCGKMSQEEIEKRESEGDVFFGQLFAMPQVRIHALRYLASLFEPGNRDKLFVILYGASNDGKTLLCNILDKVLGEYSVRPPVSQIMGSRTASSNATPDWLDMENARAVMYLEPDESGKFNKGVAKHMSGGEGHTKVQGLYQGLRKIRINVKPMVAANLSFNVGIVDAALMWRLCVIPFYSTFVKPQEWELKMQSRNERENIEKPVFTRDATLMDRYPDLCTSIACLLLRVYYVQYKSTDVADTADGISAGGLIMPPEIKKATDSFVMKGDPITRFIFTQTITLPIDAREEESVAFDTMYEEFKVWYAMNFPKEKVMNSKEFKDNLNNKDKSRKHSVGGAGESRLVQAEAERSTQHISIQQSWRPAGEVRPKARSSKQWDPSVQSPDPSVQSPDPSVQSLDPSVQSPADQEQT